MKTKILTLLCLSIVFMFYYSCQKEDVLLEQTSNLKGFHYSKLKSIKHSKKIQTASVFLSEEGKSSSTSAYDFTIDTTFVQTLEAEDYISYTFIAEKYSIDDASLYNYVVTFYNDESVHEMLVKYPLLNTISYDLDMGNITAEQVAGDLSILPKTGCPDGYPVTNWDPNQNCVDYYCGVGGGDGSHGPGQSCNNGDQVSYQECFGAWVTTCAESVELNAGSSTDNDGTTGGNNDGNIAIIPIDECKKLQSIDPNYECNGELDENECQPDFALITRINALTDEDLKNEINNYLSANSNPCEANSFVSDGLDAVDDGGELDIVNEIIKDSSFVGTKEDCVLEELITTGNNLFKQISNAFTDNKSKFRLKFTTFTENSAAIFRTSPPNANGLIQIKLNLNQAHGNAIDIAASILHESIHAELHRIYISNNAPPYNYPTDRYKWLKRMYEYYQDINPKTATSNAQHFYMAQYFVNPLSNAIQEYDNYTQNIDYYKFLAWDGLQTFGIQSNLITQQELDSFESLTTTLYNDNYESECNN